MEITVADIKPFLRFVRCISMTKSSVYPHYIPYDSRMFVALEGEGRIEADGALYIMKPGDVIFINSGIKYHVETPDAYVKYFMVNFDYVFAAVNQKNPRIPAEVSDFNESRLIAPVTFSDEEALSRVLYVRGMSEIFGRLYKMEREFSRKITMHELCLCSDMTSVIVKCLRAYRYSESSQKADKVTEILDYIREKCVRPISNREIAERFHYHENYLSRLIKSSTGMSLHRYVKSSRVDRALEMLSSSEQSISEIAQACGFYDTAHFVKCFRRSIGVAPGIFRENFK